MQETRVQSLGHKDPLEKEMSEVIAHKDTKKREKCKRKTNFSLAFPSA